MWFVNMVHIGSFLTHAMYKVCVTIAHVCLFCGLFCGRVILYGWFCSCYTGSAAGDQPDIQDFAATIQKFVETSSVGEFGHRLDLLKSFSREMLQKGGKYIRLHPRLWLNVCSVLMQVLQVSPI